MQKQGDLWIRIDIYLDLDSNITKLGITSVLMGMGCGQGSEDGGGIIMGVLAATKVGVVTVAEVAPVLTEDVGGVGDDGEVAWTACASILVVESEMAWGLLVGG